MNTVIIGVIVLLVLVVLIFLLFKYAGHLPERTSCYDAGGRCTSNSCTNEITAGVQCDGGQHCCPIIPEDPFN
ncbi:hypothetical protein JW868_02870 [Candidatus Woesearchaeota archaeon]|nr:hypothetical protein [Candidatus Woesearchaeota archaeon]